MSNVFKNPAFYRSADGSVYNSYDGLPYSPCDTKLTQKEGKLAYYEQAKQSLLKMLKPGMVVYTTLKHISSSGTSRRISLMIGNGAEITNLDYLAAIVLESKVSEKGGIVTNGCGMDMGFELVYRLGRTLWPEGIQNRNDGGYALKQEWI